MRGRFGPRIRKQTAIRKVHHANTAAEFGVPGLRVVVVFDYERGSSGGGHP